MQRGLRRDLLGRARPAGRRSTRQRHSRPSSVAISMASSSPASTVRGSASGSSALRVADGGLARVVAEHDPVASSSAAKHPASPWAVPAPRRRVTPARPANAVDSIGRARALQRGRLGQERLGGRARRAAGCWRRTGRTAPRSKPAGVAGPRRRRGGRRPRAPALARAAARSRAGSRRAPGSSRRARASITADSSWPLRPKRVRRVGHEHVGAARAGRPPASARRGRRPGLPARCPRRPGAPARPSAPTRQRRRARHPRRRRTARGCPCRRRGRARRRRAGRLARIAGLPGVEAAGVVEEERLEAQEAGGVGRAQHGSPLGGGVSRWS